MSLGFRLFLLFAVFCATFIPRMLLLGGPPATDEGIYAFNAMMIHLKPSPDGLLADSGMLNLYPALLSWVFAFGLNQFILLRFTDAIVAALAGIKLYRVLAHESGSPASGALIATGFLLTMNDPAFIQYGFKNSIAAASLPLLAAISLGQHAAAGSPRSWFWCGALMAIAVLLREPFVAFALAGAAAVFLCGGWRGAAGYAGGGIAMATLILLTVVLMRGGYTTLIQGYVEASQIYQGIAYQKQALLQTSPVTFAMNAVGALLVSGAMLFVLAWSAIRRYRPGNLFLRALFWVVLALVPLIEPLLKNGYPYHYAASLIGLSGLTALGWSVTAQWNPRRAGIVAGSLIIVFSILLLPKLNKLGEVYLRYTAALNPQALFAGWPVSTISQSNYLLIAEKIRSQAPPDATLAINGSMLGLIPLAGLQPARPDLAHLSYRYLYAGNNPQRMRELLHECPPAFIMLTNSSPFRDASALHAVVKSMPEYSPAGYIPVSDTRNYGGFDGAIFRWMPAGRPCRPEKHGK